MLLKSGGQKPYLGQNLSLIANFALFLAKVGGAIDPLPPTSEGPEKYQETTVCDLSLSVRHSTLLSK